MRRPGTVARSLVAIGRVHGVVTVRLRRDLDAEGAQTLSAVLGDLINNQGNLRLVVDLAAINALSETGVAVLAEAANWASCRGGSVRLADPSEGVRRALGAAGMANLVGRHAGDDRLR